FVAADGTTEQLDSITGSGEGDLLEFRHTGNGYWEWYRLSVVEGVLAGRFASSAKLATRPSVLTVYDGHVTGWQKEQFEQELTPRVFDVMLRGQYRAVVRVDRSSDD